MHRDHEYHHCPACDRRTRHRVSRERVLTTVMWCQECFHLWHAAEDTTPRRPAPLPRHSDAA